jgi:hypothetical protein
MSTEASPTTHDSALLEKTLDRSAWEDVAVVRSVLGDDSIVSVDLRTWSAGGGLSGDSNTFVVVRKDASGVESTTEYFAKFSKLGGEAQAAALGQPREGLFLGAARKEAAVVPLIPAVLFAHGNMLSGKKVVIMEMINGVQAGYFYGPSSLHNWGKDLKALTAPYGALDERTVTLSVFRASADLHAAYWGNQEVLLTTKVFPELRCRGWAQGEDEASWNASMNWVRGGWDKRQQRIDQGLKLSDLFVAIVDASFAKTTWEAFQTMFRSLQKTVVQGDCHPSNVIVPQPEQPYASLPESCAVKLVDWEAVAVGSGPQDLGQYMISHSSPESRRAITDEGLKTYVAHLESKGVNLSLEEARREFVQGGLGRWMWMLPLLIGLDLPVPAQQFFVDQATAFIEDHGITPDTAPFVRA